MKRLPILGIIIFLVVALFVAEKAFAGAWTVPKYKVWAEYYTKWNYAKEEFDADGNKTTLGGAKDARSWELVMEPKIEYGLTDWLNFLWSMEYKEANYKEYGKPASWGPYTRKNHGITTVKVGGKCRLTEAPFVISAQTKVFIYPGYGINHGDDAADTNKPDIGKGDDAVEVRALIGKKFDVPLFIKDFKLPCYFGAELGYRWRNRNTCNDIPYFFEAGFWPVTGILIKTEIDGYKYQPGTGSKSKKDDYGVWRIGGVWEVLGGDSVFRQGNKLFNVEFQYGMTLWGKSSTAYQEFICKVQTQF